MARSVRRGILGVRRTDKNRRCAVEGAGAAISVVAMQICMGGRLAARLKGRRGAKDGARAFLCDVSGASRARMCSLLGSVLEPEQDTGA